MKIQKLPPEARSKLQSGIIVTDAVQCVMELVHNSLDAEASGVVVRIDVKAYQIRVIDNGKGIKKEDLEFVGERFMTSKYHSFVDLETSFHTYGFRGQALSSLQDVSRSLTIETKSDDNGPTLIKIFKNNKALPITEIVSKRNGTGTTITIEDFMYTMPVRRARVNEVFDLEEIKNQLQYLAIIHYNVCFTLRNENKGLILLQTPQASNILESLANIFGKTLVKSLKALNHREKMYDITGYISLKSQPQNNVQLLYLNKRIVTKGVIHKFINNMIKEYRGKKTSLSNPTAHEVLKALKSSYNTYIIQIKCPHSYYELFTNLRKTTVEFSNWKDVLKCIHKAVKKTLKKNLNLNSLYKSQHSDDKNADNKDNECKGAFGTSFLVNAVRGAPVKRGFNTKKIIRQRKKIKANGSMENYDLLNSKSNENQNLDSLFISQHYDDKDIGIKSSLDSLNSDKIQKECANDSLESPIPKKKLKPNIKYDLKLNKTSNFNQSFFEFYEWLKKKLDTDTNAFNLYHDFLQFKSKTKNLKEVLDLKSPVFGGKLKKKKKVQSIKKKKTEKCPQKNSSLDKEIAVLAQKQLKKLPSSYLKMKKAVQYTSEMRGEFSETLHLNSIFGKNLNFEKRQSLTMFKKPEKLTVVKRNQRQVEYNQTLLSLPSSEAQFTNIIQFRNLSESCFRQSCFTQNEILAEKTVGTNTLNTWSSHYQSFVPKNEKLYEKNFIEKNHASGVKSNVPKGSKNLKCINFRNLSGSNLGFAEYSNKKKEANAFRDVEIQVNVLEAVVPVQKINAIVQTLQVSEFSSFRDSYLFNEIAENTEINFQECQLLKNISQEVPHPDFWNMSSHIEFEEEIASNMKEINSKNLTIDLINEKHSTSNEFVCGHKSHCSISQQNEKSSSKETQSLAHIWTDSLIKLRSPIELRTKIISNSKSVNIQLPDTLPVEEIKYGIPQPLESGFFLTERHDFVPKGLSPKFLKLETAHISILSPHEKSRMKLTIDNTQNDLLANVKWQDESTGQCLKPIIPDGIFFEMLQRAGECAMNNENTVLSASLSYCAIKIQNLLHSFAFTKELFTSLKILGQLDKKFIVTLMKISAPRRMELISLFDQHAVDERIKLEELINVNISPDGKFISSDLNSPVEVVFSDFDVRVVSDLKEKIFNFGLTFELINKNTMSVKAIPTFLLKKYEKNLKSKKETDLSDLLKSFIANIIDESTETRGAVSKIPKIMHNAFCLEACHKAIKFNKALTIENMTEMINKLQKCRLPFQCAHGRPSVIPIIDLEDFKPKMEANDSIDLQDLKRFYNQRKDVIENSKTVFSKTELENLF